LRGLRVVDASAMPGLTSGNTNGPVMALAWRAAEIIRAAAGPGAGCVNVIDGRVRDLHCDDAAAS